ncbi:MAG: hypothetical protein WCT53_06040, partial [Candidatus Gracilibacteria bacterium]
AKPYFSIQEAANLLDEMDLDFETSEAEELLKRGGFDVGELSGMSGTIKFLKENCDKNSMQIFPWRDNVWAYLVDNSGRIYSLEMSSESVRKLDGYKSTDYLKVMEKALLDAGVVGFGDRSKLLKALGPGVVVNHAETQRHLEAIAYLIQEKHKKNNVTPQRRAELDI